MTDEKNEIKDAFIEEASSQEIDLSAREAEEKVDQTDEERKDKKIKNLVSAVILLAGLFVGSLFVDGLQMIRGGGFSQKALSGADAFSSGGKTWVAFSEPLVKLQVITDDTCEACKPDEVLVGLKGVLPTMLNEKIDANSQQGKKLIATMGIKTLPAFVFSKEIENTELFAKAEPFLEKKFGSYVIKSAEAGFPVGKYVSAPSVLDNDIKIGSNESALRVVSFANFQNPADKDAFQTIVTPMIKEYGDKIQFVFKGIAAPNSIQGSDAVLAAACANEQGKFLEYADKLFATQSIWGKTKDAAPLLKSYATMLGIKSADFNKCLDDKKYKDLATQPLQDAQSFGISATPAIFIGTELKTGSLKYDDIKAVLDEKISNQ